MAPHDEATLSTHERERLLHRLHGYLVWVGAEIPDVVEIDGRTIPLHELIWKLFNKSEVTDREIAGIESLIRFLEKREACDEHRLARANLTEEDAYALYNEASGLLRAIMDLKEIEQGRHPDRDLRRREVRKKIRDAHALLKFVDELG
ncbi:MAG: DUF5788 family protein [Euryarchaeota archaeon]|nr:MAG: hypothetical protein C5S47_04840 [ANME-2 cluster archaeon]MEA1864145.1 DUF5788 family protein [Euryarchaeota archaeon]